MTPAPVGASAIALQCAPPSVPVSAMAASLLHNGGLNLRAVFHRDALPRALREALPEPALPQVILIGHGGRRLWTVVGERRAAGELDSDHPIDLHTRQTVNAWAAEALAGKRYRLLFPLDGGRYPAIDFRALGRLAGWHFDSPFMVGVHPRWGSWFAYRALLIADSDLPLTAPERGSSPCTSCEAQPCRVACPAGAVAPEGFALGPCSEFRLRPGSPCALTCLSRLACPVGRAHRYDAAQMAHSYQNSLNWLRAAAPTSS